MPPESRTRQPSVPELREPSDAHDERLIELVCPPDWTNPSPRGRYDLLVIGGGTGGLVTAAIAASLGARVALAERRLLGGDCLNTGCVPSKAVVRAARAWREVRRARPRFGAPALTGEGDFSVVMDRMRAIRADMSAHDSAARFAALGVDVFLGDCAFTGPETAAIDGVALRFRRAVIATGSRAAIPYVPGLDRTPFRTNESIFALRALPPRLAVIGGGPIGCELAQSFAAFGTAVTLLECAPRLLPRDDPEAAEVVRTAMHGDGVRIHLDAELTSVERRGAVCHLTFRDPRGEHEIEADEILLAAGRRPNVSDLGLEAAGVPYDPDDGVLIDERLRTANPRVYAIGDVASRLRFTHVADAHARLVVRNALFRGRGTVRDLIVPWCTYTSPELAHTGLSPGALARDAKRYESITVEFRDVDRARIDAQEAGFVRLHLRAGSDRIVAATVVGEHAGELITQLTQAIATGTRLSRLADLIYPYPTYAEAVRKAGDSWRRRKLTPTVRRMFDLYFRISRR